MSATAPLTAAEIAAGVRAGELDPVAVLEQSLARIDRLDPATAAWVHLDCEQARGEARALAKRVRRGEVEGVLLGVPFGVKDLIDVAGMPTANGSQVSAGARHDAPVVAALRREGAIALGKTRTSELGAGVVCAPTANPCAPGRIAGGSSGGSAAAVAAGMCPLALGTDTAGSIRIPAALCGVAGLRPRSRALPLVGITALSRSFDSCGPIAATVADLALCWRALSGSRSIEPAREPRIGAPGAQLLAGCQPEVAAVFDTALASFAEAGARPAEVELRATLGQRRERSFRLLGEMVAVQRERGCYPSRVAEYEPATRRQLEVGDRLDPRRIASAEAELVSGLAAEYRQALGRVDVIALPTVPRVAPPSPAPGDLDAELGLIADLTALTGQVNWCDLAAVTVPCGRTGDGLPVGLQLIGEDEEAVLASALAFEHAFPAPARPERDPFPSTPRTQGCTP